MNYMWIQCFAQDLHEEQEQTVLEILAKFTENWTSHESPVESTYKILHHRFLVITGSTVKEATGCTHDRVTRLMQRFEKRDIHMAPRSDVFYRDNKSNIQSCTRAEFKERFTHKEISEITHVFDTTLINPDNIELFEIPLKESWHMKLVE